MDEPTPPSGPLQESGMMGGVSDEPQNIGRRDRIGRAMIGLGAMSGVLFLTYSMFGSDSFEAVVPDFEFEVVFR